MAKTSMKVKQQRPQKYKAVSYTHLDVYKGQASKCETHFKMRLPITQVGKTP